jgi:hypothetical protein
MKHPQNRIEFAWNSEYSDIQIASPLFFKPSAQRDRKVMGLENLIGYLGMFKDVSQRGGAKERWQGAEN